MLGGTTEKMTGLFQWAALVYIVSVVILWMLVLCIYRTQFHPLAKFPGPKLAGATYLYEFWFDVICWGRYTHQIEKLHQLYGPIIRINPDELHCNDPAFINTLYTNGAKKRNKSSHFLAGYPMSASMTGVATVEHDLHRTRKNAVVKFFSRAQVSELEVVVHDGVQRLCEKLLNFRGQGPFELADAYSCFTCDMITGYCFGEDTGFLDQPGWEPNYKTSVNIIMGLTNIMRFIPFMAYAMEAIPLPLLKFISPKMGRIMTEFKVTIPARIRQTQLTAQSTSRPTIFSSLLQSDLPPAEKSMKRLASEANAMMIGGTESTAVTLRLLTYHLLANPSVCKTLRAELECVVDDARHLPSWLQLEQLPYLSAVVQESLRLVYGVPGRLARIAPDEDMVYCDTRKAAASNVDNCYVIPRGFAVGMSSYLVHSNEDIFPEPHQFKPERWLDERGQKNNSLGRYLMSFSKGSRQCVGMQ
ncbi:hypothetical protein NLG97_g337 [Lecanicillium saksenae]|uniref:Uncharacterized protein n=1 Tax=Lecanicillium saksenae TaxID=468837 RepID=A0ACC1R9K9_9HYPO|nr:hypothetical protein NLG97_g337 [Lecanicillium saksenae]